MIKIDITHNVLLHPWESITAIAQLVEAVEYKNCTFLEKDKTLTPNKGPKYDTKQSDGEVPKMLELWGMWSTPSLPLLSGSF